MWLRHHATPNDRTAQQPVHQEIDLTETQIDLEGLGEALAESIQHSRAASSTTDSAEESSDSDETDAVPTSSVRYGAGRGGFSLARPRPYTGPGGVFLG